MQFNWIGTVSCELRHTFRGTLYQLFGASTVVRLRWYGCWHCTACCTTVLQEGRGRQQHRMSFFGLMSGSGGIRMCLPVCAQCVSAIKRPWAVLSVGIWHLDDACPAACGIRLLSARALRPTASNPLAQLQLWMHLYFCLFALSLKLKMALVPQSVRGSVLSVVFSLYTPPSATRGVAMSPDGWRISLFSRQAKLAYTHMHRPLAHSSCCITTLLP